MRISSMFRVPQKVKPSSFAKDSRNEKKNGNQEENRSGCYRDLEFPRTSTEGVYIETGQPFDFLV